MNRVLQWVRGSKCAEESQLAILVDQLIMDRKCVERMKQKRPPHAQNVLGISSWKCDFDNAGALVVHLNTLKCDLDLCTNPVVDDDNYTDDVFDISIVVMRQESIPEFEDMCKCISIINHKVVRINQYNAAVFVFKKADVERGFYKMIQYAAMDLKTRTAAMLHIGRAIVSYLNLRLGRHKLLAMIKLDKSFGTTYMDLIAHVYESARLPNPFPFVVLYHDVILNEETLTLLYSKFSCEIANLIARRDDATAFNKVFDFILKKFDARSWTSDVYLSFINHVILAGANFDNACVQIVRALLNMYNNEHDEYKVKRTIENAATMVLRKVNKSNLHYASLFVRGIPNMLTNSDLLGAGIRRMPFETLKLLLYFGARITDAAYDVANDTTIQMWQVIRFYHPNDQIIARMDFLQTYCYKSRYNKILNDIQNIYNNSKAVAAPNMLNSRHIVSSLSDLVASFVGWCPEINLPDDAAAKDIHQWGKGAHEASDVCVSDSSDISNISNNLNNAACARSHVIAADPLSSYTVRISKKAAMQSGAMRAHLDMDESNFVLPSCANLSTAADLLPPIVQYLENHKNGSALGISRPIISGAHFTDVRYVDQSELSDFDVKFIMLKTPNQLYNIMYYAYILDIPALVDLIGAWCACLLN